MDLVTREEFDVQVKVLERTRSKLEALEKQFAQLIKEQASPATKTTNTKPSTPKATAKKA